MKRIVAILILLVFAKFTQCQIIVKTLGKNEIIRIDQSLTVQSPAEIYAESVETSGELIFEGATLNLSNNLFKARKIIIKKTVINIKVIGSVKMSCDNFEMESGRAADLVIDGSGVSELIISYKTKLIGERYVSNVLSNGKLFSLRIEKLGK